MGLSWQKTKKQIKYPSVLDMGPYLSSNPLNNHVNDANTPKTNSGQTISFKYQLYGVLIHEGTNMNSGHYYSFIKGPNNCWYKADDDSVSLSSGDQPLKQEAYVLFYIREDIPPPPTPKESPSNPPTQKSPNLENTPNDIKGLSSVTISKEDDIDNAINNNVKKRKLSFNLTPVKQRITNNGVIIRNGIKIESASLQSIPTWNMDTEEENIKLTTEKQQQMKLTQFHSTKIQSMQVQLKDTHDKELDKGRTKKVKRKKTISNDSNQFQFMNQQLR